MAKDDSESRRQRLRQMRDRRLNRNDPAGAPVGDDERIDRALAERRRGSGEEGARDGQRPLERFPRLREALAQRRQSQGGDEGPPAAGGRRRGDVPAGGQGRGRVMFARRFRDLPQAEGEEMDDGAKLAVLERRMETLRAELDRSAEELRRLKSGKPEQQKTTEAPESAQPTTTPQTKEDDDPDSLSAWLKAEGESESHGDSDPDGSER